MLFYLLMTLIAEISMCSAMETISSQEDAKEYCLAESFHPQCPKNEVILMESASYGRMRIGKCLKGEEIETLGSGPRHLGCSVDVLPLLDEQCSGKTDCEIRVIDISDEKRQPCFSGLKMHLEASYRCIKVSDKGRACAVMAMRAPIHVEASQSSCGSLSQPWTVEAPLGQKVVVSLLDLTPFESRKTDRNRCLQEGVIVDKTAKRNISICVDGAQREKQLYTSPGNKVEIFLSQRPESAESSRKFPIFFKFEAIGCSDVVPSEDTWLKRRDDTIVIGCYSSRQTWQLNCNGGKWTGVVGNCSHDMPKSGFVSEQEPFVEAELSHKSQVLAIVSICGFTLAICFTIMCIRALCLRRYYIQNKGKTDYRTLNFEHNSGRSAELPIDRMSRSLQLNYCHDDAIKGLFAQQTPTYSVYVGHHDGLSGNADDHLNHVQSAVD